MRKISICLSKSSCFIHIWLETISHAMFIIKQLNYNFIVELQKIFVWHRFMETKPFATCGKWQMGWTTLSKFFLWNFISVLILHLLLIYGTNDFQRLKRKAPCHGQTCDQVIFLCWALYPYIDRWFTTGVSWNGSRGAAK